ALKSGVLLRPLEMEVAFFVTTREEFLAGLAAPSGANTVVCFEAGFTDALADRPEHSAQVNSTALEAPPRAPTATATASAGTVSPQTEQRRICKGPPSSISRQYI